MNVSGNSPLLSDLQRLDCLQNLACVKKKGKLFLYNPQTDLDISVNFFAEQLFACRKELQGSSETQEVYFKVVKQFVRLIRRDLDKNGFFFRLGKASWEKLVPEEPACLPTKRWCCYPLFPSFKIGYLYKDAESFIEPENQLV